MTIPDPQPPLEPDTTPEPELPADPAAPAAKPRRKRRTKAEMEAVRAAKAAKLAEEANKPLDPNLWLSFGGLLLLVSTCIFFDPIGFSAQDQNNNLPWIYTVLLLAVGILGKNPTAIFLLIVSLLSLGWGIRGWLRKRSGADL